MVVVEGVGGLDCRTNRIELVYRMTAGRKFIQAHVKEKGPEMELPDLIQPTDSREEKQGQGQVDAKTAAPVQECEQMIDVWGNCFKKKKKSLLKHPWSILTRHNAAKAVTLCCVAFVKKIINKL